MLSGFLHDAKIPPHFLDDHLAGRPEQLDLKNPVTEEISCDSNLAIIYAPILMAILPE